VDDESPGSGPSAEPAPEPDPEPAPDPDPTPSPAPNPGFPTPPALSSAKAITGFKAAGQTGSIDAKNKTVTVTVPWDTDWTNLTPDITISPRASIDPASGEPRNFSTPVTYTVTAEDGSKAEWEVTVALALSSEAEITAFTIPDAVSEDINEGEKTVTVTLPWGMALTGLGPVIEISKNADIAPASGEARDFFTASGFTPVTYTVTAEDGTKVKWIVTVKWAPLEPGDISTGIGDYLDSPPSNTGDGSDADHPIVLPVNIDLASGGLADLLSAINKFVALDLSACTGMTVFDPDNTTSAGEDKIVSLTLPDTAESVKEGASYNSTFKNFTALKSVAGKAKEIGEDAFFLCIALETVSLPAATDIGNNAFYSCTSLTEVDLPMAKKIGNSAFEGCDTLETVTLKAATDIGDEAFRFCTSLTTVTLGWEVPKLGTNLFNGVNSAQTVSVKVPSGATGYALSLPVTFSGPAEAGDHWGEGFRGKGWNGSTYTGSTVNGNITLTITDAP
jgi:hypothetical protein